MEGRVSIGSLFDKKDEMPTRKSGESLLHRLAAMAASIERRVKEAFNKGYAARRFNGVDVVALPQVHLEEVREAPASTQHAMGRFSHVTTVRFQGLEEVAHGESA